MQKIGKQCTLNSQGYQWVKNWLRDMLRYKQTQLSVTYTEDADSWKITDALPFLAYILFVADEQHVLQLVVLEVARSERHDEITKSYYGWMRVGKEANYDVVAENRHGRLFPRLKNKSSDIIRLFCKKRERGVTLSELRQIFINCLCCHETSRKQTSMCNKINTIQK